MQWKPWKISCYLLGVLLTGSAFLVFYAVDVVNGLLIPSVILTITLSGLLYYCYRRMRLADAISKIHDQWGQQINKERDYKALATAFRLIAAELNEVECIDDMTWHDLHMDLLYAQIDRTMTIPGEQILYNILRMPLLDASLLKKRLKIIHLFQENSQLCEKVQLELTHLAQQDTVRLTTFLWQGTSQKLRYRYLPQALLLLSLLSVGAVYYFGPRALVFGVAPVFGLQLFVNDYFKKLYSFEFPILRNVRALIVTAQKLGQINQPDCNRYSASLNKAVSACKGILRQTAMLGVERIDSFGIYEYLNIFLLIDIRSYYGAISLVRANRKHLQQIYSVLGEIDALLSIASWRSGTEGWIEPQFAQEETALEAEGMWHPLLNNAVPNTVSLHRPGFILTGSNMSGKSTFLRTIGTNVLLAQTTATCFATTYHGSMFRIITSISKEDRLPDGKSYYMMEAESLLEIIQAVGSFPCLCIIDEIFRGTHSLERIPAAIEVLRYLAGKNALSLVATHDLDVAKACADLYPLYYFSERVSSSGLEFDYQVKEGLTTSWNAIKILQHLGYPEQVITRAMQRIESN